jgi:acetolactate synthase I/II/III large subunit
MDHKRVFTGGQMLARMLRRQRVERVFCVPGESYLAVLDALVDFAEIAVVTCRHEGTAAMMAEAYGKLTGRPGIVFASRGPGATNAAAGIHIAFQDSSPVILFVGQIDRANQEREAFQEIDYRRMYGPLAKWVAQIDDVARIPELVSRAFYTATAGRPGPVVLALPEDMLTDSSEYAEPATYSPVEPGVRPEDLDAIRTALVCAERPFVIAGGGGWSEESCRDLLSFVSAWDLPVGVSFRCQDYFDNTHPNYAGDIGLGVNPALARTVRESDLLLVLGARLGEATTSTYTLLDLPVLAQKLIHIHPSAEELGRVYQPTLGVNAGMRAAPKALASLVPPSQPARWKKLTAQAHASYLEWTAPPDIAGELQVGEIMAWLRDRLAPETIVTNGAGNFAIWPNRFHRYRRFRSMLAPTSGSMGYGIPAAISAKLHYPDRMVIAFTGDGDLMMSIQELATARMYGANILIILLNNGMYGTIRMHQEREYPGRVSATALRNPEFVTLIRGFGGHAERVTDTAGFIPAFERCVASGTLSLLELVLDPDVLGPGVTISGLRSRKKQPEVR